MEDILTFTKTQKTICKHLLEEEYSRSVANDPTFAAQVNLNAQLKIDHLLIRHTESQEQPSRERPEEDSH